MERFSSEWLLYLVNSTIWNSVSKSGMPMFYGNVYNRISLIEGDLLKLDLHFEDNDNSSS